MFLVHISFKALKGMGNGLIKVMANFVRLTVVAKNPISKLYELGKTCDQSI